MMHSPDDLKRVLDELAGSARDVPDMALVRAAHPRPAARTRPVLLAVGLLVVVLAFGLGISRTDLLPTNPASGPTRAVPPAVTASASAPMPTQAPTATPSAATPDGAAAKVARPMTRTEITDQTAQCLNGEDGLKKYRRGDLKVRYAMVQAAVGYPSDSTPRTALLLEDDVAYYDCSSNYALSVGKGGDDVKIDPAAAGIEVPTLSGGSTPECNGPKRSATIDSAAVLKTSARARSARVTVRAAGASHTATLPTRDDYLYVAIQLTGESAWKPSSFQVELLDAQGERLSVQPYLGKVMKRLTYPLPPCTQTDR